MTMPDGTDIDSIELEFTPHVGNAERVSLAVEDPGSDPHIVESSRDTSGDWTMLQRNTVEGPDVTAYVDGEEVDVVEAILDYHMGTNLGDALEAFGEALGFLGSLEPMDPPLTIIDDSTSDEDLQYPRSSLAAHEWDDGLKPAVTPSGSDDDDDGFSPGESDADNPEVNGHHLSPTDPSVPGNERIWQCDDCGRRGTSTGVFHKFDCDE